MEKIRGHSELNRPLPEMVRLNEAVTAVDVESLIRPRHWQEQIIQVVMACGGKPINLKGGEVSTSKEPDTFTTVYTVVKGPEIEKHLPWLWELYQGLFRELVSKVAGQEVDVDPDKKFSANINTMTIATQKDGYELHTDINHWTGMLGATTINEGDGGELVHVLPDGTRRETRIKAGWLYIFDGLNHPHKVNRLNPDGQAGIRITVPMDYLFKGVRVERPDDLKKIFGEKNGEK